MSNERISQAVFLQTQPPGVKSGGSVSRTQTTDAATNFGTVLQQRLQTPVAQPLTFSGHALQRLQQRQINLTQQERQALTEATAKARDKGAKETLILAEKAAFVVSVRNNTVITVMDRENLKDNVFTQIDSAIVL